jgi:hypothetical protein
LLIAGLVIRNEDQTLSTVLLIAAIVPLLHALGIGRIKR